MIRLVATATFREAVRSRSFIALLGLHLIGVLLARVVGWISSTDGNTITTDLVFSLQSIIGVLVAVATGTALVHVEIKQRTLYTVLSRPMARWHFVFGKYLGLGAALVAGQIAMLTIGCLWLWVTGAEVHGWLLIAGILTCGEVLIMAAVALALTALTSPLLAAVLGLAVYALGHAVSSLPGLMYHLHGWQRGVATALAAVIPNLGMFAYRNDAVHHIPLPWSSFLEAIAYAALWVALLMTVTVSVYRRKQL